MQAGEHEQVLVSVVDLYVVYSQFLHMRGVQESVAAYEDCMDEVAQVQVRDVRSQDNDLNQYRALDQAIQHIPWFEKRSGVSK